MHLPASTLTALLGLLPQAAAGEDAIAELPEPSEAQIEASIQRWDPSGSVRSLEQVEQTPDGLIIELATDILFTVNSWELPDSAGGRIAELVEDLPHGAEIQVIGHTDSVPTGEDFDNLELSQQRADAVAGAVRQARPDLEIQTEGRGDAEPAVTERQDAPETLAANRRVEIIHHD
ncbi:OmpA/MotB family protein [Nesterenkonia suensis]